MKMVFYYLIEITSLLVKSALIVHFHSYIIIIVKLSSSRHIKLIISASYIIVHLLSTLIKMNIIIEIAKAC